ncbi:MAG: NAD(P)H-binding protein [Bryobacterales bacterium]|nr:NAD(P)H-binding protein [Bryobacterales bacterium]
MIQAWNVQTGYQSNVGESSVFLTGAGGFLGRAVVKRLIAGDSGPIVCLVRRPGAIASSKISYIKGDLLDPKSYRDHLKGCDTVLHLAAITGKAAPSEYLGVNRDATAMLAQEAARATVKKFIFVSSIAAKFKDPDYHYGQSKLEAERKLRQTALDWIIVRPTMILGTGSPIEQSLAKLATMPVVPIFGNGKVRVQPVFVNDLAKCLVDMLDDGSLSRRTIEIGGPQVVTIEELMQLIRQRRGNRSHSAVCHLPIGPISACLRLAEPLLRPLLPFTSGQLASFRHDGVAEPDAWITARQAGMRLIKEMLNAEA